MRVSTFSFMCLTDNERLTVRRNTEQANILNIKLSNYAVVSHHRYALSAKISAALFITVL